MACEVRYPSQEYTQVFSDEITREMNAFLKMYETNICNMNALRS